MPITPDPEYDFIEPLPRNAFENKGKRGTQCGECGMKFEYGQSYGFRCGNPHCPTGWGMSHIASPH